MSLLKNAFDDIGKKLADSMKSVKGGASVRVSGGASVGAEPTQIRFNPILIVVIAIVAIMALFTKKR